MSLLDLNFGFRRFKKFMLSRNRNRYTPPPTLTDEEREQRIYLYIEGVRKTERYTRWRSKEIRRLKELGIDYKDIKIPLFWEDNKKWEDIE